MADVKKNTMIAQAELAADLLSDRLEDRRGSSADFTRIAGGGTAWTDGVLSKVDHRADGVEQRLQARRVNR